MIGLIKDVAFGLMLKSRKTNSFTDIFYFEA